MDATLHHRMTLLGAPRAVTAIILIASPLYAQDDNQIMVGTYQAQHL